MFPFPLWRRHVRPRHHPLPPPSGRGSQGRGGSSRLSCRGLKDQGILLASGPLDPRNGGALLLRVPEDNVLANLDRIRDEDPFVKAGVAQYELLPWLPNIGKEDLDRL